MCGGVAIIIIIMLWVADDETVHAGVGGLDYVEVTSAKAPPSFLSLLVAKVAGFRNARVRVAEIERMTRSGARIRITCDAVWSNEGEHYKRVCAVFALHAQ